MNNVNFIIFVNFHFISYFVCGDMMFVAILATVCLLVTQIINRFDFHNSSHIFRGQQNCWSIHVER